MRRQCLICFGYTIMNEVDLLQHEPALQRRPIMSYCRPGTKYTHMLI